MIKHNIHDVNNISHWWDEKIDVIDQNQKNIDGKQYDFEATKVLGRFLRCEQFMRFWL